MTARLVEHQPVNAEFLKRLAVKRAGRIADALIQDGKLAAGRDATGEVQTIGNQEPVKVKLELAPMGVSP